MKSACEGAAVGGFSSSSHHVFNRRTHTNKIKLQMNLPAGILLLITSEYMKQSVLHRWKQTSYQEINLPPTRLILQVKHVQDIKYVQ